MTRLDNFVSRGIAESDPKSLKYSHYPLTWEVLFNES
jgi:hypothetical protein